jgi:hypothetical protein
MRQERVHKTPKATDRRPAAREDEPQERPEIRKDLQHWFKER